nr:hypothetical protein [Xylophilus sp.]
MASDVDAADDADFNRWYDSEHVEERVRIPGFISGARYFSAGGGRKYLGLYRTESLGAFQTEAYPAAFQRQTPWSVENLGRMRDPIRRVCAVQSVTGFGSGSHLAVIFLPLETPAQILRDRALEIGKKIADIDGFVQSYLLSPDTALSTPLPKESTDGRQLHPMFAVEASRADAIDAAIGAASGIFDTDAAEAWRLSLGWKLHSADLA